MVSADSGSVVPKREFFLIPSDNIFHYLVHALLIGLIVSAVILFLKPKDYDAHDVEVSGLYCALCRPGVDVYFLPLVYLMSTRI